MDLERRVGQNLLVSQTTLSGILEKFADLIKAQFDAIPTPLSDLDQLIREMVVQRQAGR